jgi:hypothetical protein
MAVFCLWAALPLSTRMGMARISTPDLFIG